MTTRQPKPASLQRDQSSRARLATALPWLWIALSALSAVIILTTNQLAWPLAFWIVTTLGPLTALRSRLDRCAEPTA
ncbi:MAG: hypothetical protein ACI8XD_000603 [Thermoproteota archaeon]